MWKVHFPFIGIEIYKEDTTTNTTEKVVLRPMIHYRSFPFFTSLQKLLENNFKVSAVQLRFESQNMKNIIFKVQKEISLILYLIIYTPICLTIYIV